MASTCRLMRMSGLKASTFGRLPKRLRNWSAMASLTRRAANWLWLMAALTRVACTAKVDFQWK